MAKEEHREGTGTTKDDGDSGPTEPGAPDHEVTDVREPTESTGEPIHHAQGGDPGDGAD